jgi:hypothetical protein
MTAIYVDIMRDRRGGGQGANGKDRGKNFAELRFHAFSLSGRSLVAARLQSFKVGISELTSILPPDEPPFGLGRDASLPGSRVQDANSWENSFHEPAWARRHLAGEFLNPTTPSAGRMPALPGFIVPLRGFQTVEAIP